MSNVSFLNADMSFGTMEETFPAVDCGHVPFGSRVVVQMRRSKKKTKGGIILSDDTKDSEIWNNQTGKVVAVGPLAFKDRKTGQPWPEGLWATVGDFVRTPKHAGDRWQMPFVENGTEEQILFQMFNDGDLLGKVTCDPRTIKTFV